MGSVFDDYELQDMYFTSMRIVNKNQKISEWRENWIENIFEWFKTRLL